MMWMKDAAWSSPFSYVPMYWTRHRYLPSACHFLLGSSDGSSIYLIRLAPSRARSQFMTQPKSRPSNKITETRASNCKTSDQSAATERVRMVLYNTTAERQSKSVFILSLGKSLSISPPSISSPLRSSNRPHCLTQHPHYNHGDQPTQDRRALRL